MSSLPSVMPDAARLIIYLGMDVHKDSITIAVLPAAAKTPTRIEKLPNDLPKLSGGLRASRATGRFMRVTKRVAPDMYSIARSRNGGTRAR